MISSKGGQTCQRKLANYAEDSERCQQALKNLPIRMAIVIVPGIHPPALTHDFINRMEPWLNQSWVVPQEIPVYSPQHLFRFLQHLHQQKEVSSSLLFIGFSAGVVGSIGAARQWSTNGGHIKALIALDGWGVPLYGNFAIHRISHDYWTHSSSHWLGDTGDSIYASPPVSHLDLWRSPPPSVITFIQSLLRRYGEEGSSRA